MSLFSLISFRPRRQKRRKCWNDWQRRKLLQPLLTESKKKEKKKGIEFLMSDSTEHAHSGSAPDLRRRTYSWYQQQCDVDKTFTDFLLEFESLSLQIPPCAIKFKLSYSEENCEAKVMVSGCAYFITDVLE